MAAAILVAGLLPLVFVGVVGYRSAARSLRGDTETRLDDAASATSAQIDRLLFERYGDVQALAQSVVARSLDPGQITALMATTSRSFAPYYRLMVVAGRDGHVRSAYSLGAPAAAAALAGRDVSGANWFLAARRSTVAVTSDLDNPLLTALADRSTAYDVEYSAPVYDAQGRFAGVWADFVSWPVIEHLLATATAQAREPSLHLFLLDRGRAVIASDLAPGSFVPRLAAGATPSADRVTSVAASAFVSGARGTDLVAAAPERGYSAYRGLGWTTVAVEDSAVALGDASALRTRMLEIGLAGGGVLVLAALLVSSLLGRAWKSRSRLEGQLRQSQKLEAVGQLAGGIAHDFSNLLTVISGNAQLALHPARRANSEGNLYEIVYAVERASDLVRRLLAFSRAEEEVGEVRVVDANAEVAGFLRVLPRVLQESIEVRGEIASGPAPVRIDPVQLDQVTLNLALNARDAMPDGGVLTLATELDEQVFRFRVGDTGIGMDEQTQERIFEPFFTTKDVGMGTGLGLATVHGIVTQAGGSIAVDSAPGVGTTFTVELPLAAIAPGAVRGRAMAVPVIGRGERILFAEDEEPVRVFGAEMLTRAGYEVVAVADGVEALEALTADPGFDLVVSDVMMPHMTGPQLLRELRARGSRVPVLFVSGYLGEGGAGFEPGSRVIAKPYTIRDLTAAIRDRLAAAAAADDDPLVEPP